MEGYLPQFPTGPLDEYRKRASFDWRKMKLIMVGEEVIKLEEKVWKTLESDPLFAHNSAEDSFQDYRRTTFLRMKRLAEYNFLQGSSLNPSTQINLTFAIGMYDWSLAIRNALTFSYFKTAVLMSGTKRHEQYTEKIENREITGCFALTEIGHGSNVKKMETKATYDASTQEFVLHSPRVESMKCWVGAMGEIATHAVVYAQLYTPDGSCHGLHMFVVPIRDPKTFLPYPGIIVGDMGLKLGLNGIDNGFISFNHYRIPRKNLLNRNADVSPDGHYLSPVKDPKKRLNVSLGVLSNGRITISGMCITHLRKCMPIAIRYSALRKQFGPDDKDEIPILEYQTQQWRLFPYLAATYVLFTYTQILSEEYFEFLFASFGEKTSEMADQAMEFHAISCSIKPLSGWIARDAIQECREACGGHGYLKASGLGTLRNDNDANCTYEGDNNVLIQQTSNYLLGLLKRKQSGVCQFSHLKSVSVLDSYDSILKERLPIDHTNEALNMNVILHAFSWLLCWLLQRSSSKFNSSLRHGKTKFDAQNSSQVYFCHTLSRVYIEHYVLQTYYKFVMSVTELEIQNALDRLGRLFGLWSLQKYLPLLYEGDYCPKNFSSMVQDNILKLCTDVKDDAVALVDAIAPPDFILNSVLGKSDGQLYKNMYEEVINAPKAQERPFWWKDILTKPSLMSKI